jgi:lysophospholipase L1-like esterase
MQRTILCYGDSNTWGFIPTQFLGTSLQRYSRNQRWTGLLQDMLGKDYYVVEEGLNGRTTNLDYTIPLPPDRNGKTYLLPCLYSHAPIDLVILALGGNDLKVYFKREPQAVQAGLLELIQMIQASQYGPGFQAAPKILILPLSIPSPEVENYLDDNGIVVFKGGVEKGKLLAELYAQTAEKMQCYFLDTTKTIFPSPIDGLHLDETGHKNLAQMIYKKISAIFIPDKVV